MLEDVNSVKAKPATTEKTKKDAKNKRYFKEKIRASKVFGTFKLNWLICFNIIGIIREDLSFELILNGIKIDVHIAFIC